MIRPFLPSDFDENGWGFSFDDSSKNIYPPQFWESNACFQKKIEAFPEGCLVYANPKNNKMLGYAVGHPWRLDLPIVPLNCLTFSLPEKPDCFYLHDVAVLASERGKGVGKILTQALIDVAHRHNFIKMKLVSVQNSHNAQKFGFQIVETIEYPSGSPAYVMVAG